MKKLLYILFIVSSALAFSQTDYKEIPTEKLDTKKVLLAKSFIQSYLEKCLTMDYSIPSGFKVSEGLEKLFTDKISEVCESNRQHFGTINLDNLNSAYKNKTSLFNGQELYIFDAKTEKDKTIQYLSAWISKDNTIEGMVITSYKPFKKKK